MTTLSNRATSVLWIMLLTLASTLTTLVLACATPFPALAALAATQMGRRDGIALMLATWGASQAVGFGVLGYPHDPRTIAWGVALGTAAVTGVIAARRTVARSRVFPPLAQIAIAYLAATIAFKLAILLWSFGLGGTATTLSPSINARQLVRNAAILVGLWALYRGLVSLGLPAARHGPAAA